MSDNELDNLFKEAAEGFKVPEDSSAWSDMSARLVGAGRTPSPSFWNWKSFSSISLLGITGIAILWYSFSGDPISVESKSGHDEIISSTVPADKTNTVEIQSANNSLKENNSNSIEKGAAPDLKNASTNLSQPAKESDSKVIQSNTVNGKQQFLFNESKQNSDLAQSSISLERIREENSILDQSTLASNISQPDNINEKLEYQSSESESKSGLQNDLTDNATRNKNILNGPNQTDTLLVDKPSQKAASDSLIAEQSKPDEKQSYSQGPRLSIKVSVSPDFSSIKMFTPDKPGINYGAAPAPARTAP
jgi:hypothetical protein